VFNSLLGPFLRMSKFAPGELQTQAGEPHETATGGTTDVAPAEAEGVAAEAA
jgi:hypothetical protein